MRQKDAERILKLSRALTVGATVVMEMRKILGPTSKNHEKDSNKQYSSRNTTDERSISFPCGYSTVNTRRLERSTVVITKLQQL